eukprot:982295-Heterocapsa_arctica.AAC.1
MQERAVHHLATEERWRRSQAHQAVRVAQQWAAIEGSCLRSRSAGVACGASGARPWGGPTCLVFSMLGTTWWIMRELEAAS